MALQGSGTISIGNIVTEFGGAAPHSMSEYYRGGAYVGSNNTNVPTTGAISMSNFYGASAFTLNNGAVFSQSLFDANSPYILFDTNGDVFVYLSAQEGDNWGNPLTTSIGSSYDVLVSKTAGTGTMTGAALDTWHNLGTARQFTMTAAPNFSLRGASGTWQIRAAGGGSALASGTWSLSSDRTG